MYPMATVEGIRERREETPGALTGRGTGILLDMPQTLEPHSKTHSRRIGPYVSVGTMPLPEELREMLEHQRRRGRRKVLLWLLAVPSPIVLGIAGAVAWPALATACLVMVVCGPVVTGGVAYLFIRDAMRMRRAARRAIEDDALERFELEESVEAELRSMAARNLPVPAMPRTMEVLPGPSRIVAIDGVAIRLPGRATTISHIAEAPERSQQTPPPCGQERALTAGEVAEIRAFQHRLVNARSLGALLFHAMFVTMGALAVWSGKLRLLSVTAVLWGAGLVFVTMGLLSIVRAVRLRLKLRDDLALGVVQVVSRGTLEERARGTREEGSERPEYIEELPFSRVVWTVGGRAAAWRAMAQNPEY
jgi:hypothetical protein